MTPEQKSIAGRKGGLILGERRREVGPTEHEMEGHRIRAKKISDRRTRGDWTEKELAANMATAERRRKGNWTDDEKAAREKLTQRRRAADWSKNELAGFFKVSVKRKSGKWITNDIENKFIFDLSTVPEGWRFGFIRKGKGA